MHVRLRISLGKRAMSKFKSYNQIGCHYLTMCTVDLPLYNYYFEVANIVRKAANCWMI